MSSSYKERDAAGSSSALRARNVQVRNAGKHEKTSEVESESLQKSGKKVFFLPRAGTSDCAPRVCIFDDRVRPSHRRAHALAYKLVVLIVIAFVKKQGLVSVTMILL